jgi:SOS-response transcriptional repressor LexA
MLTKRQAEAFNWIRDYILKHDHSPTYRQIAKGLKLSSTGSAYTRVERLVQRGVLGKAPGGMHGLSIIRPEDRVSDAFQQGWKEGFEAGVRAAKAGEKAA